MRPGKKGLEIQCTRWPVSVLHELCPGLEYSVSEMRSPGLYYPMFEVSAVVGGQHFTNTGESGQSHLHLQYCRWPWLGLLHTSLLVLRGGTKRFSQAMVLVCRF